MRCNQFALVDVAVAALVPVLERRLQILGAGVVLAARGPTRRPERVALSLGLRRHGCAWASDSEDI